MAASLFTAGTWPQASKSRITSPRGGDLRQLLVQFNLLCTNLSTLFAALVSDSVITQTAISRGTTTSFSTTACNVMISGVPVLIAASSNTAFTTALTITADTWGIIAFDAVAAGTVSSTVVGPGATQAYTSEALAIAAVPAKTANKARLGYLTILTKAANTWVANTDSLAGGATGNVATTTNYYPAASLYDTTAWTANQIANLQGTVETSAT